MARQRLKASTKQLRAYTRLQKRNELATRVGVEVGAYRAEILAKRERDTPAADIVDPIAAGFEKLLNSYDAVRRSRVALARQGAPLADQEPGPPDADGRPTDERIGKGDVEQKPIYLPSGTQIGRRYRRSSPVEKNKDNWPEHIYVAFAKLIDDFEIVSLSETPSTGNYDGVYVDTGGQRSAATNAKASAARQRLEFLQDVLSETVWTTLMWLVLERVAEKTGRRLNVEQVGNLLWPAYKDKKQARAFAMGSLQTSGCQLSRTYRLYYRWQKLAPRMLRQHALRFQGDAA